MSRVKIEHLLKSKKCLLLACDQGLEHGPSKDFNEKNIDPNYIMHIALEGHFQGVILQPGVAEKYHVEHYKDIPLIVKLNGKTSLLKGDPYSAQTCSVDRAIKMGAEAVGYTIYPGSKHEAKMFAEFGKIVEQAHDYGIPVICWLYPRGEVIHDEVSTEITAYAARIGLELGADFVKIKYNKDLDAFKWVINSAGRTKVLVSGGDYTSDRDILQECWDTQQAGATGMAIGRAIWQNPKPFSMAKALQAIMWKKASVDEAMKFLED